VSRIIRLLILGGIVFSPLLALLIAGILTLTHGNTEWLLLALPSGRRLGILWRSLAMSAGAAVIDVALGVLIACACWGWSRRFAWLRWLPLALIALPPYIHALAWNDVVQQLSFRLGTLRPPGELLSVWVMAMSLLPVGIGLALISLESVARPLVDAALTSRDDQAVFWRVALPLAAPLLAAGGGLIFLLNLLDYSVPSLFGVNVYALEIFAEFSSSNQPVRALLLSFPVLLIAFGVLFAGQTFLRRVAQLPLRGVSPWSAPPQWRGGFSFFQKAALVVWGLQGLVPLVVLVKLTDSGGGWLAALQSAGSEFVFSFSVAGAAALLSLPLGWLAMEELNRRARINRLAGWLFLLPVAIPAPLIGIGLVTLWNHPIFDRFYASAAMPVLAALARFAPMAALVLLAQNQQVDTLLLDAARVFQARDGQTAWRVRLPLLSPGLLASASLIFALTLGELGATLIVVPPGQPTLTLRIYNYLHYGASDVVAGLCLAILLLTLAGGAFSVYFMAAWSRRVGSLEQR